MPHTPSMTMKDFSIRFRFLLNQSALGKDKANDPTPEESISTHLGAIQNQNLAPFSGDQYQHYLDVVKQVLECAVPEASNVSGGKGSGSICLVLCMAIFTPEEISQFKFQKGELEAWWSGRGRDSVPKKRWDLAAKTAEDYKVANVLATASRADASTQT